MSKYNRVIISKFGEFEIILDSAGQRLFDSFTWSVVKSKYTYYLQRHLVKMNGKRTKIRFHTELLGNDTAKFVIDHINGNGLDNRIVNLRICTQSENMCNQRKTRGISRFKGVTFHKGNSKWQAQICKNSKRFYLGQYKNEEDAARAYNKKAKELFGKFALLNEISA